MKIIFYSVPEDEEGRLMKNFLEKNNLPFKEVVSNEISILEEVCKMKLPKPISLIKIIRSHSIGVIVGFDPLALNQLVEHIKKYNPKFEF